MANNDGADPERPRRPEPSRTKPIRSGLSGAKATAERAEPPPSPQPAAQPDADSTEDAVEQAAVHQIVADAVRLGYDVVGENLRLGRIAADRFSAGQYGAREAKHDVAQLGKRVVQLSRDLSTVWFDLLGAVLRDPNLREALRPRDTPERPGGSPPPRVPVRVECKIKGNSQGHGGALHPVTPRTPLPAHGERTPFSRPVAATADQCCVPRK